MQQHKNNVPLDHSVIISLEEFCCPFIILVGISSKTMKSQFNASLSK